MMRVASTRSFAGIRACLFVYWDNADGGMSAVSTGPHCDAHYLSWQSPHQQPYGEVCECRTTTSIHPRMHLKIDHRADETLGRTEDSPCQRAP